jgi:hypothetical protein
VADKGRLFVEQCIRKMLFFNETGNVMVTQRQFHASFQTWWVPSFKAVHKIYNQFNNDGSVLFSGEFWHCQVINRITVHIEGVGRCNCGHIEHLIHRE